MVRVADSAGSFRRRRYTRLLAAQEIELRSRPLAILFATVLAFGAFIWLFERDLPSSEERSQLARKILPLQAEEITGLRWVTNAGEIVLDRQESAGGDDGPREWRISAPLQDAAENQQVDTLVRSLLAQEWSRRLEDYVPATVGLEEPRATVTVVLRGGEERTLEVGAAIPASSNMIVRLVGGTVAYVTSDSLYSDLEKPAADWRRKKIFPATREQVESISLRHAGSSVKLVRREEGFWLEEPVVDRVGSEAMSSLLLALTSLRVEAFIEAPGDLAEWGLEPAEARLEAGLGEGRAPFVLEWGKRAGGDDGYYARYGDIVFITLADLDPAFHRAANEWRLKTWSRVATYEIDRLRIDGESGSLDLERENGDWLRDGEPIEYSVVSDFLYTVSDAQAEQILIEQMASLRLGEPRLTITLHNKDGEQENLRLFAEDGRVLVTTAGRDAVLVMPTDLAADLEAKALAIREAERIVKGQ